MVTVKWADVGGFSKSRCQRKDSKGEIEETKECRQMRARPAVLYIIRGMKKSLSDTQEARETVKIIKEKNVPKNTIHLKVKTKQCAEWNKSRVCCAPEPCRAT